MHFGLVTDEYCAPSPTTRGTAINMWSIMISLLQASHKVTVFVISNESSQRFEELAAAGVTVKTVPYGRRRPYVFTSSMGRAIFWPALETFYPWVALAPSMKTIVEEVRPDAVLGFNLYNLAATHRLDTCPRMAVFVDPDHLVAHYRWLDTPLRPFRNFFRASLRRLAHTRQQKFMTELLADCQAVVNFAAHHAAWFQKNGVPNCLYMPPPTRDAAGSNWRNLRDSYSTTNTAKILLIGHLGGIASISGIRPFITKVLPRLEEKLGINNFEVHVVGDYSKNPMLAAQLRCHPTVRLRGYVEDVNIEFLSSDILLVPTPINLGTRTRIIEGFSYGCCVVAHEANALGIPQMVNEENALLARDGLGLAHAIIRALTDAALRERLQCAARRTYEEYFSIDKAGALLTAELEKIARNRAGYRPAASGSIAC
jgi:glycosyltransferase involved in cell wall biosynthesis